MRVMALGAILRRGSVALALVSSKSGDSVRRVSVKSRVIDWLVFWGVVRVRERLDFLGVEVWCWWEGGRISERVITG